MLSYYSALESAAVIISSSKIMYKNHDQLIDVITIFCGQSLFEGYGVP